MSLQVNDPRSGTRSKSPGRSRERSRSRDSRVPSPSREHSRERSRARSPVVEIAPKSSKSASRSYGSDEEAEIERQYKLLKEGRLRDPRAETENPRGLVSRAPRSPARYDARSDSDDSKRRERGADNSRRRDDRDRDDRYEHSDDDVRVAHPREHPSRSQQRPPVSPVRPSRRDHSDSGSDSDDHLAYGDDPGSHPSYARPGKYQYAQPAGFPPSQPGARKPGYPGEGTDWAAVPECERPGFVPPSSQAGPPTSMPGGLPAGSGYPDGPATMAPSYPKPQYVGPQQPAYAQPSSGPYVPTHYRTASAADAHAAPVNYAQPGQYQYAQVDPNVRYTSKATPVQPYTASPQEQFSKPRDSFSKSQYADQPAYPYRYSNEPQFVDRSHPQSQMQPQPQPPPLPHSQFQPSHHQPQVVEITPGGGRGRPHSLSVSSGNNLAVAGAHGHVGHPPASPLLEPYRGTYQSMSPMPSPIMMPSRDDDISDFEQLDGGGTSNSESGRRKRSSRSEKETRIRSSKDKTKEKEKERDRDGDRDDRKDDKRRSRPSGHDRHESSSSMRGDAVVLVSPSSDRKRVSFYDAASDALTMQGALNHTRNIDNKAIIQVLPRLSTDEILILRQEYKNKVKMHGKGINLAKHLRLKLGNSNFGKVAYATALGRWESEAYWANCYYQAGTSRRELLIESLIGRSNAAIREIKSCFRDTRYNDSLERCMRAELRADKFRVAVLLALEERRQDEREPIDTRLIRQDVSDLHRALVSKEGGETAMIHIIVLRSDAHLREVLRTYEGYYGQNFARAMIAKSRNLVGETLAHILNGAINRPMRDALLLHQALRESRSGRERSELLISRLVRLHWEPRHLELVKAEYRRRYNERLEEAIAEEVMSSSGGTEWGGILY
ncbi:uncharacterized protein N7477_006863 [Penicillium maclennaniae]|uniref:uncharacterized protein n=1 Tax=Penicillium maclennaniae TaxID=1343394 RepID=UPI002540A4EE|nr:uncharacterized protein N7477_006863 [Penicillium maclennaniae]KAJ5668293.1 hypothetical protein N7477_006863 [Penicillium maclennaniae]